MDIENLGKGKMVVLSILALLVGGGIGAWKGTSMRDREVQSAGNQKMEKMADTTPRKSAEAVAHNPTEAAANKTALQAQIEAMEKHNQEMQAQIEALRNRVYLSSWQNRPTVAPRDGVLIISGKDKKESAQGLRETIEAMNAVPVSRR